jgi:ribosome-binding factor A
VPRDYPRARRVADQIQRELSGLIRLELRDPRVRFVTLTEVEVSRDLAHARVWYTVLGDPPVRREVGAGLERAAGFLRSQLAHRLGLRVVPQLEFAFDESVERGARLARLIDEANAPAADAGEPPQEPR